jgi:osmotically-inducible protein OsmY
MVQRYQQPSSTQRSRGSRGEESRDTRPVGQEHRGIVEDRDDVGGYYADQDIMDYSENGFGPRGFESASDVARPNRYDPQGHARNLQGTGSGYGDRGPSYREQYARNRNPESSAFRETFEAQPQTSHRGRGPKGYQRSDQRLLEDICERLSDDPYIDASDIEVTCESGNVTLAGTVESRAMKHEVEDLVADCHGAQDIVNNLKVAAR